MEYVVSATGPDGQVKWLTPPKLKGFRTFAAREGAEIFATEQEAESAIGAMLSGEDCRGLIFSAEPADRLNPPHFC
jgi:hypothetical protein